jgi:NifU-like protein involved in Fe-S cluster formation
MYTPLVQDHFANPRNVGPLEGATHRGAAGSPGDGPYVILWLQVEEGTIRRAAYQTYPCPAAIACGSITAEVLAGRTVEQARQLEASDVIALLRGLPEGKEDRASLAVEALRRAIGEPAPRPPMLGEKRSDGVME